MDFKQQPATGGGSAGPGVTEQVDLSVAPDVDPDSIWQSATASTLTLVKSGTGHTSPAEWSLRDLEDGQTVLVRARHGAPLGASKTWMGIGFQSGVDTFVVGINAHGGGTSHPMEFDGSTVTYLTMGGAEDLAWLSFHRRGTKVQVRGSAKFLDIDGTAVQTGTNEVEFDVATDPVELVAMVGLNDNTGGTFDIDYYMDLAVLPAVA